MRDSTAQWKCLTSVFTQRGKKEQVQLKKRDYLLDYVHLTKRAQVRYQITLLPLYCTVSTTAARKQTEVLNIQSQQILVMFLMKETDFPSQEAASDGLHFQWEEEVLKTSQRVSHLWTPIKGFSDSERILVH